MPARSLHTPLSSPDATAELAVCLGATLVAGDVLLLSGPVGAGKTHFARSLIQARLANPEDVPSPTFTLVQTYDAPGVELWHTDLYRLTSADEVIELGLLEAFETAITLVEWPDRLEDLAPVNALSLQLAPGQTDDARSLHLTWTDPRWDERVKRCVHE